MEERGKRDTGIAPKNIIQEYNVLTTGHTKEVRIIIVTCPLQKGEDKQ